MPSLVRPALVVAESLVAANAVGGAAWLLAGGRGLDITVTRLPRVGVHRWWPGGLALLGTVAAPMAASAVLTARRSPGAAPMSVASGVTLVGWVIAQRVLGVPASFLQPTLGAAGALVAAGGWRLRFEDAAP
jgi:hypothetical protein